MINVSKINKLSCLEEIKTNLIFFINDPSIEEEYKTDPELNLEELPLDREEAKFLLKKINKRIKLLKSQCNSKLV